MKKTKIKLLKILLLSAIVLFPSTIVSAKRKTEVLIEVGAPSVDTWEETQMGKGNYKVELVLIFPWSYDGELVGYATQYAYGIAKDKANQDKIYMLHGYGIVDFLDPYSGTLTYTIGNNWNFDTGDIWAFRMRVVGGTGDFEGVKGQGVDAYPNFILCLNFDPFE